MTQTCVSVIIATKNEQANISRVLTSIFNQTVSQIETLVIDNYSTDDTVRMARKMGASVFLHGNERSQQRNFGAKIAKGTYLLFLDADMELLPSTIDKCLKLIKSKSSVALVIPEKIKGEGFFVRIKNWKNACMKMNHSLKQPDFLSGLRLKK